MTPRKPITDKMKWMAIWYRYGIDCVLCDCEIIFGTPHDWDHIVELADGGSHDAFNVIPVHVKCHARKSGKKESERHHIDRLEKEKNGLPKRARPKKKWAKRKMRAAA